ncbi:FAD/NAD(P)-binding oxidoreductase family protein isoform X2 [Wolffia australiana]
MRIPVVFRSSRRIIGRNATEGPQLTRIHEKNFCSATDGSFSQGDVNTEKGDQLGRTSRIEQYDVAIVGGGMVGMAFVCALSRNPMTKHLKVAIIDNNPALKFDASFKRSEIPDPRVSTVTPASISFFRDIKAWEYVEEQRHAYFDKMQVWDYTGLGYTRYNAQDVGKRWLGCVVENKVLHHALLSSFKSGQELHWKLYPAKLTSMIVPSPPSVTSKIINLPEPTEPSPGTSIKLDLSDGNSLLARLVVGADGSNSNVRAMAALKSTRKSYSQSAIICTVEHVKENDCAWQRFLPSGPIALLPIGDRYSNVVWTMRPDEAASHKSMPTEELAAAIDRALGHGHDTQNDFLGGYVKTIRGLTGWARSLTAEQFMAPPRVVGVNSETMVFPLSLMHAQGYVARRVALVGDAAHTVHPLAGQGVNLGFADAAALATIIADGICAGSDIGEINLLRRYEKERKAANATMMTILDGFQKAFSVDAAPLNLLRAAAFHGANYIPFLKRNIISYASGDQKWPIFP